MRGVLAGTPSIGRRGRSVATWSRGRRPRAPRVSSSEHHARAGWTARLRRQPARQGPPPRGGRPPRWDQRGVLRASRARQRERRVRGCPRRHRSCAAARRSRPHTPLRPRASRQHVSGSPLEPRPPQEHVRPVIQRILDSLVGVPAFVENERLDVLAANALGEAFYAHQYADPARPINGARFMFLNPKAKEFLLDWDTIATDVSAYCGLPLDATPTTSGSLISSGSSRLAPRSSASAGPRTPSTCIAPARSASSTQSSASSRSTSNGSSSPATPASGLTFYSAEPSTPSRERLDLLASWASTPADARRD